MRFGLVLVAGCSFHRGTAASDGAPACLDDWCRRKAITIPGSQVDGGPHADFPLLVSLPADPELHAEARSDGFDIRFTASDGVTPLAYERQSFVAASGQLVAWVRVPTLPADTDTVVYMYYGNSAATDQQDRAGTWDASYQAVWHLEETAGGAGAIRDATTHGNHGTDVGSPMLGVAGQIGEGASFDGIDDQIRMLDSASLDSIAPAGTIGLWIDWVDAADGAYQIVMSSSNRYTGDRMGIEWASQGNGNHYFYPCGDGAGTDPYNLGPDPFANATWQYLAVTFDYATHGVVIYVDGVPMALTTSNASTMWTTLAVTNDWLWGGNADFAGAFFAGVLDEVRVASTVRSPGWIATEYRNQRAPAQFYEVGPETVLQ